MSLVSSVSHEMMNRCEIERNPTSLEAVRALGDAHLKCSLQLAFCAQLWPGCGASGCPLAFLLWFVGELAPLQFLLAVSCCAGLAVLRVLAVAGRFGAPAAPCCLSIGSSPAARVALWRVRDCTGGSLIGSHFVGGGTVRCSGCSSGNVLRGTVTCSSSFASSSVFVQARFFKFSACRSCQILRKIARSATDWLCLSHLTNKRTNLGTNLSLEPKWLQPKMPPKISRFFPSPTTIFTSFFILGVFSWNCGRGSRPNSTQSARVGFSGVKPPLPPFEAIPRRSPLPLERPLPSPSTKPPLGVLDPTCATLTRPTGACHLCQEERSEEDVVSDPERGGEGRVCGGGGR